MLQKLISIFYIPDKAAIEPLIHFFRVFGIWYPERPLIKTIVFYIFYIFSVVYVTNMCLNLIINFNYDLLIECIQYSSFTLAVHKTSSVIFNHKNWEQVFDNMKEIEKESISNSNLEQSEIIYKYKSYCQFLTYCYWIASITMIIFMFSAFWINGIVLPALSELEDLGPFTCIFKIWLPFDQNSRSGRFYSGSLQTLFGLVTTVFALTWDPVLFVCMVFFTGQMKALRIRCVRSLDHHEELCWNNLMKCYNHHKAIIKCTTLFNTLISPVTFAHICQISTVSGICIIKFVLQRNSTEELVKTLILLMGTQMQMWLFYKMAYDVTIEAETLTYGMFESKWVERSTRVRRAVLMLSMGMRKRIIFKAGPFNEMSLNTLLSIIKASYSLYTLLSHNK